MYKLNLSTSQHCPYCSKTAYFFIPQWASVSVPSRVLIDKNHLSQKIKSLVPVFIKNYFKKTKSYSLIRFIIESSIVAILGKMLVAILAGTIIILLGSSHINELSTSYLETIANPFYLFSLLCILTPVLETIIFQWLPITLLQKTTSNIGFIIGIDSLIFALPHWLYSFIYMLAIFPVSIMLAWSFILNKDDSLLKALWVTASIHALINFSSFVPLALS